jgi:hypothetical protein
MQPVTMASQGRGGGQGGGCIGGGGGRDHVIYRPVAVSLAERACIICSEEARKHAVHKWTNYGARPSPKLAPYATYAMVESCLCRRPRSSMSPLASDDDDDADLGRVIGPEDFAKDPAEEERALAKTAEEATAQQAAEEAERLAALRAIEAF